MQKIIEKLKSYNLTKTAFVGLFLGIFLTYYSLSWLGSILHRVLILGVGDISCLVGFIFLFFLFYNSEFRNTIVEFFKRDYNNEDVN
jgi:uncharacterized membrane protein YesL